MFVKETVSVMTCWLFYRLGVTYSLILLIYQVKSRLLYIYILTFYMLDNTLAINDNRLESNSSRIDQNRKFTAEGTNYVIILDRIRLSDTFNFEFVFCIS